MKLGEAPFELLYPVEVGLLPLLRRSILLYRTRQEKVLGATEWGNESFDSAFE